MATDKPRRSAMDRLLDAYGRPGGRVWSIRALVFAAVVGPVVLLAAFNYQREVSDLTDLTFLRRQAIAYLASVSLRTKFDGLVTLAQTAVDNDDVRALVGQGKWEEALDRVRDLPGNVPHVHIMSFYTPDGRFMAAAPESTLAVGTDLSARPWYKGVSRTWLPYVSDIGKTAAPPYEDRVIVSIPIKGSDEKVIAIFNLSIKLDAFLSWSRAIDAGPSAFVYFTDRLGQVAGHKYLNDGDSAEPADQSAFPPVAKALRFERGIEVLHDPTIDEQAVVAYEPVLRYGWTAIVEQSAKSAFASRDAGARTLLALYGIIVLLNCALALIVIRFIDGMVALRRREKMFLDSVGEGLLMLDTKGKVIMANPTAESLLGRKFADMFGKDIDEVAPLTDLDGKPVPRDRRPVLRALRGAKVIERGTYLDAKRRPFHIAQTASPVRMGDDVVGVVIVFRDVTREAAADAAKKQFVSAASQQLQEPVAASKGRLRVLLDGDLGELTKRQREELGELLDLNQRMTALVDDLLNLSRIELGVLESSIEAIDPKDFVRTEMKAVEPVARKKKISLQEDLDGVMPELQAPPRLLRTVLQNLLSNAVKYTPEGGAVTVTLRHTRTETGDEHLIFSVSDTGIGIPAKDRERVFEKFHRADNAQSAGEEGTGLGLFIVRSVVAMLKGNVRLESVEGKGTTVSVELPTKVKPSLG